MLYILAAAAVAVSYVIYSALKKPPPEQRDIEQGPRVVETFIDPIYPNEKKIKEDWYSGANGSIYGEQSHLMSGYPYYDRAY